MPKIKTESFEGWLMIIVLNFKTIHPNVQILFSGFYIWRITDLIWSYVKYCYVRVSDVCVSYHYRLCTRVKSSVPDYAMYIIERALVLGSHKMPSLSQLVFVVLVVWSSYRFFPLYDNISFVSDWLFSLFGLTLKVCSVLYGALTICATVSVFVKCGCMYVWNMLSKIVIDYEDFDSWQSNIWCFLFLVLLCLYFCLCLSVCQWTRNLFHRYDMQNWHFHIVVIINQY